MPFRGPCTNRSNDARKFLGRSDASCFRPAGRQGIETRPPVILQTRPTPPQPIRSAASVGARGRSCELSPPAEPRLKPASTGRRCRIRVHRSRYMSVPQDQANPASQEVVQALSCSSPSSIDGSISNFLVAVKFRLAVSRQPLWPPQGRSYAATPQLVWRRSKMNGSAINARRSQTCRSRLVGETPDKERGARRHQHSPGIRPRRAERRQAEDSVFEGEANSPVCTNCAAGLCSRINAINGYSERKIGNVDTDYVAAGMSQQSVRAAR